MGEHLVCKKALTSLACLVGGPEEARTPNLRLAKPALSQLSYSPDGEVMVGLSGFEPLTSRLSAVRSSQLSYRPVVPHEAESTSSADEGRLPKNIRPPTRRTGGSLKTR